VLIVISEKLTILLFLKRFIFWIAFAHIFTLCDWKAQVISATLLCHEFYHQALHSIF